MGEVTPGAAICFCCGGRFDNDTVLLVHLCSYHVNSAAPLLRERRLEEVVPNVDPDIFRLIYSNNGRYENILKGTPGAGDTTIGGFGDTARPKRDIRGEIRNNTTPITRNVASLPTNAAAAPLSETLQFEEINSVEDDSDEGDETVEEMEPQKNGRRKMAKGLCDQSTGSIGSAKSIGRMRARRGSSSDGKNEDAGPRSMGQRQLNHPRMPRKLHSPFTHRAALLMDPTGFIMQLPVACLICKQEQPNFAAAMAHDMTCHNIPRFPCGEEQCSMIAKNIQILISHMVSGRHTISHRGDQIAPFWAYRGQEYATPAEYAKYVLTEYHRMRLIHYRYIALRSADLQCKMCQIVVKGADWFAHCRICQGKLTKDTREWVEADQQFCHHQRDHCQLFPACQLSRCSFSHPICAHHPNCYRHRTGKCLLDHSVNDRTCTLCYQTDDDE